MLEGREGGSVASDLLLLIALAASLARPKVQQLVATLERQSAPCKEYTSLLRDTFQACHLHQVSE